MDLSWLPCIQLINLDPTNRHVKTETSRRKSASITIDPIGRVLSTKHKCLTCGANILQSRVDLSRAPGDVYKTKCSEHSDEKGYFGLMEYAHKTAGYIVKTKSDDKEQVRRMKRVFNRARDR